MTIPASSSSPPPLLSPSSSYTNPLLPVFTSTVAAAVLLPTSHATPTTTYSNFKSVKIEGRTTRGRRRRRRRVSSSDNQTVVEAPAATTSSSSAAVESPSLEVVRNFYGGINGHDLASVEDLIAHDCVYEDLIFSRPFVGRKVSLSGILLPLHFFLSTDTVVQPLYLRNTYSHYDSILSIDFRTVGRSIFYWEVLQVCIACTQLAVYNIQPLYHFEFITFCLKYPYYQSSSSSILQVVAFKTSILVWGR